MTTTPDPRPRVRADNRTVEGRSCPSCGWTTFSTIERCARCATALTETAFGPAGTIWSSTIVRVPVPGRTPPYAVAYVDLDEGPRVLCHVATAVERPPVGTRVAVCGSTAHGDLLVEVSSS